MDKLKINIVVPSLLIGKPVMTALSRTFGDYNVVFDVHELQKEMCSRYDSVEAEIITGEVVREARKLLENIDEDEPIFVVCSGSAFLTAVAVAQLVQETDNVYFLVWENQIKRYVIFNILGSKMGVGEVLEKHYPGLVNEKSKMPII